VKVTHKTHSDRSVRCILCDLPVIRCLRSISLQRYRKNAVLVAILASQWTDHSYIMHATLKVTPSVDVNWNIIPKHCFVLPNKLRTGAISVDYTFYLWKYIRISRHVWGVTHKLLLKCVNRWDLCVTHHTSYFRVEPSRVSSFPARTAMFVRVNSRVWSPCLVTSEASWLFLNSWHGKARRAGGSNSSRRVNSSSDEASCSCNSLASCLSLMKTGARRKLDVTPI
jgi:hypothetical protein